MAASSGNPAYAAGQQLGFAFRSALRIQLDTMLRNAGLGIDAALEAPPLGAEAPQERGREGGGEARGGGARGTRRTRTAARTPSGERPTEAEAPAEGAAPPAPPERTRLPTDHPEMPPSGPPAPAARPVRAGRVAPEFPTAPGTNFRDTHPELVARLNKMYRDAPPEAKAGFQGISGHRTYGDQVKAYRRYRTGRGGIAAPPGRSRHERGEAVDIRDTTGWFHRNASRYGIHFPVRGDYPHAQMDPRYRGQPFAPGAPPASRDTGAPQPPHPFLGARDRQSAAPGGAITGAASTYNPLKPGGWRSGGVRTASGERYDPNAYTASIQSGREKEFFGGQRMGYGAKYEPRYAEVEQGGKKLIVRINDRGPLTGDRVIDLNERSMRHFDPTGQKGVLPGVTVRPLPPGKYTPGPVAPEKPKGDQSSSLRSPIQKAAFGPAEPWVADNEPEQQPSTATSRLQLPDRDAQTGVPGTLDKMPTVKGPVGENPGDVEYKTKEEHDAIANSAWKEIHQPSIYRRSRGQRTFDNARKEGKDI